MMADGVQRRSSRLIGPHLLGMVALACGTLLGSGAVAPAAEAAPSAPATREASCGYSPTAPLSQVANPAIREASALVASRQWPGTYWTLNDSKNSPTVFGIDEQGQARGAFQVPDATNVDWEAMQLGPDGAGGTALYIGDIGDNARQRRDSIIYRIPEPEPADPGVVAATPTDPATGFRFRFPAGAENAEAMIVHPKTGEILLFSRATTGYSLVFSLPMLTDSEQVPTPEFVDILDVRQYEASRAMSDGQITDGSVSSDGRHVVLRTYASALIYDLPEGAPLASIIDKEPRVYPLGDGPKGEGISFRVDSEDLLSIGESKATAATLFETPWQCS
jgi:hypothetical protein